jgi:hypothetical protein
MTGVSYGTMHQTMSKEMHGKLVRGPEDRIADSNGIDRRVTASQLAKYCLELPDYIKNGSRTRKENC